MQSPNTALKKANKKIKPTLSAAIADRVAIVTVLHNDYLCHFARTAESEYIATCPRFPSLIAAGATLPLAEANLTDEITTWIEAIESETEDIRMSWLARTSWGLNGDDATWTERR